MHTIMLTIRALAVYFTTGWRMTGQYLVHCAVMHRVYTMTVGADKFIVILT
jgi:hypothetical protein